MEPQEQKAISSLFIAEYYKWLARARSQNRDDAYVREKICEIMHLYFGTSPKTMREAMNRPDPVQIDSLISSAAQAEGYRYDHFNEFGHGFLKHKWVLTKTEGIETRTLRIEIDPDNAIFILSDQSSLSAFGSATLENAIRA